MVLWNGVGVHGQRDVVLGPGCYQRFQAGSVGLYSSKVCDLKTSTLTHVVQDFRSPPDLKIWKEIGANRGKHHCNLRACLGCAFLTVSYIQRIRRQF